MFLFYSAVSVLFSTHTNPHTSWLFRVHPACATRSCRWAVKLVPGWKQPALLLHFCCRLLSVGANINVAVGQSRLEQWSGWKQCARMPPSPHPRLFDVRTVSHGLCQHSMRGWEASAGMCWKLIGTLIASRTCEHLEIHVKCFKLFLADDDQKLWSSKLCGWDWESSLPCIFYLSWDQPATWSQSWRV